MHYSFILKHEKKLKKSLNMNNREGVVGNFHFYTCLLFLSRLFLVGTRNNDTFY